MAIGWQLVNSPWPRVPLRLYLNGGMTALPCERKSLQLPVRPPTARAVAFARVIPDPGPARASDVARGDRL